MTIDIYVALLVGFVGVLVYRLLSSFDKKADNCELLILHSKINDLSKRVSYLEELDDQRGNQ